MARNKQYLSSFDNHLSKSRENILSIFQKLENSLEKNSTGLIHSKSVWRGIKLPSKFSMIKYICEANGVCGDLQEQIEKNYTKNNMENVVGKYHLEKQQKFPRGYFHIGNRPLNMLRYWKSGGAHYLTPISYENEVYICGMEHNSYGRFNPHTDLRNNGISIEYVGKKHMVEVMKNHGLKFNKSKKKVELWKIFVKSV